jgi:hypothetical protein
MSQTDLQGIVNLVLRRAHRQGFVVPREVREELTQAGMAQSLWKDVLAQARNSLRYDHGRYYYLPSSIAHLRARARQEKLHAREVQRAIRQLIRLYKDLPVSVDRRIHPRIDLIQPVRVQTEDRRTVNLLTRDISIAGIRMLGTCNLLGQKIRVWIPRPRGDGVQSYCFLVHILWSATVGDELYENGGIFLEILEGDGDTDGLNIIRRD